MEGLVAKNLLEKLFRHQRSIIGEGTRDTLLILESELSDIKKKRYKYSSGTRIFDWTVPPEWILKGAYLDVPNFDINWNVIKYSQPYKWNEQISEEDFKNHLYIGSDLDAIPYITCYYGNKSGFALSKKQWFAISNDADTTAYIDSKFVDSQLELLEVNLPGNSKDTILFSTYICHPSMYVDNTAAIVLLTEFIKELANHERKYSYKFLFLPETIGSLCWLSSQDKDDMDKIKAGWVVHFAGIPFKNSPKGLSLEKSLSNQIITSMGNSLFPFRHYGGSDERQFNAPGFELPIGVICGDKFFKEYHSSADNLSLFDMSILQENFDYLMDVFYSLERNIIYRSTVKGEPFLSRYKDLYPTVSTKDTTDGVNDMMRIIAYCNGKRSIREIALITGLSFSVVMTKILLLEQYNIVEPCYSRHE